MSFGNGSRMTRHFLTVMTGVCLTLSSAAFAQNPSPPSAPAVPPPVAPVAGGVTREAQLEERIRQLESMVNRLSTQVQTISEANVASPATTVPQPGSTPAETPGPGAFETGITGVPPGLGASSTTMGGSLAPGQSITAVPAPSAKYNMPAPNRKDRLQGIFGPGFMLKTDDDEYVFQFHNLTQIDFRGYEQGGQNPVHDSFGIPRQWFMFSGRIGKPYEYFVSFAQGFDVVGPLDIFMNFNYDERIQVRLGRFKTPFTYEFFHEPIQGLISPERSLFFNNFALNRSDGVQLWGQLFEKRLDYAAGIFNTTRNSNLDFNDGKDFLSYLGYRPFLKEDDSFLQFLEVGGSMMTGNSHESPTPVVLRTQVPTAGNNIVGIPFLAFNNNVRQSGDHTFWSLHTALYRNHLSLVSEWQSGFQDYALANNLSNRTNLPVQSYYVQAGYFITGETVTNRNIVRPIKNFGFNKGEFGLGAIELTGRYNYLNLGQQVFTSGLADPNLWSNSVYTTDVGANWYLTQYTKVMLTWEHAEFGSPVQFAPGRRQINSDTFWFRFQLFF